MSTLDAYKKMHADGLFPGHSTKKNADIIGELLKKYEARKVLDYGSGKGFQYTELKLHEEWGIPMPSLYDPAVPGIDRMPNGFEPFDAVICCDVLEHLEGDELNSAIFNAAIRARKFVFFSIATFPAKKTLPDGRNVHITLQGPEWWLGRLSAAIFPHMALMVHVRFDNKDGHQDASFCISRGQQ